MNFWTYCHECKDVTEHEVEDGDRTQGACVDCGSYHNHPGKE